MKRFVVLFLCVCYMLSYFGTTLYLHQCHGATAVKLFEKANHESCPLCKEHTHKDTHNDAKKKSCSNNKCSNIEVKFEELSDQVLSSSTDLLAFLTPAILPRFWVDTISPVSAEITNPKVWSKQDKFISNSSPPVYLTNCTFII